MAFQKKPEKTATKILPRRLAPEKPERVQPAEREEPKAVEKEKRVKQP